MTVATAPPGTRALHLTEAGDVRAIMAGGLIPMIGPRAGDIGESEDRVHLFPDADSLIGGLGWMTDAFGDDVALSLLEVDVSGMAVLSGTDSGLAGYEIAARETIPPDRLRLLCEDVLSLTENAIRELIRGGDGPSP